MTPAILLLQRHAVGFRTHTYEHVANNNDYRHEAVSALNLSIHQVYKTLVCHLNSKELVVVVLPVAVNLNLKHLALAAGAKKAQLPLPRQVQAATGYLLRGISPLAQKKQLRTFINVTAQDYKTISIRAGRRGLEIEITATDLSFLTQGKFVALGNKK